MEHVVFRIAVTHRRHNSKYDRCRPRSPAHDTTRYCRNGVLNGARSKPTAAGLATKVRNRAIAKAGRRIEGICEGNASSPKRKKNKNLHKAGECVEKAHQRLLVLQESDCPE